MESTGINEWVRNIGQYVTLFVYLNRYIILILALETGTKAILKPECEGGRLARGQCLKVCRKSNGVFDIELPMLL
jgi:hypothetical protein